MKLDIQIKEDKIFSPLKEKWLILTPEEKVRQNYIAYLVNYYGYDLKQMEQEVTVSNAKRGQGKARADIVIWKNETEKRERKNAFIVVECKAENVKIQRIDYFQGLNYATWAKAKFFVTTNEKETKFFKILADRIPDDIDEIVDIPNAKDAENEKEINKLLLQTKKFTRDEFQKLLFKCHNIIRNNDKLSPEMAFDEISKILFMKIRYERKRSIDEESVFSLEVFKKQQSDYEKNIRPVNIEMNGLKADIPYMDYWFELTKSEFKKDTLFEENDKIKIKQNSFEQIIKELEKYNLSDTSDDVKGIAFEEFLGKTFRGDLGQFFTPRTIVDFMVHVLDPQENEIICDPCCGTGGFLIKAFEYVRDKIEKEVQETKDKIKNDFIKNNFDELPENEQTEIINKINTTFAKLNKDLEPGNTKGRLYDLSYRRIFGTDAEPRSARTAKMNMIMHGDGHGEVHHHDGLLNVNGIFEGRFDIIMTNPPFGARLSRDLKISETDRFNDKEKIQYYTERYGNDYIHAMKQISDNIDKKIIDLFDLGESSNLSEVLFMERCLKLLKKGGRMGIVLPEGVLNNSALQKVREYFEGRAKILLICSIPQDVFIAAGATVKPSLLFLKKFTEDEEKQWEEIQIKVSTEVQLKYSTILDKERQPLINTEKEFEILHEELKKINILKGRKKGNLQLNQAEYDKLVTSLQTLKDKIKEEQKIFKTKEKQYKQEIQIEIRKRTKEIFDYEIAIVQVEKAGITATGAPCENELIEVVNEFSEYRNKKKLWDVKNLPVEYFIKEDEVYRMVAGEKQEIYG